MTYRLKRIELAALLALLLTVLVSAFYLHGASGEQAALAEKLVRLHVLANSDSAEDQARKLLVKDAVFARTEELLRQAEDQRQAEELLTDALPELERLAEEILRESGSAETVTAELTNTDFFTRYYDWFTLPAGEYRALRIVIGEGKGQNWWCVVYPPLCSAGEETLADVAARAGLTEAELRLIQSGEGRYLLRFRSLEWLQRLRMWLK